MLIFYQTYIKCFFPINKKTVSQNKVFPLDCTFASVTCTK